MPLYEYHCEKCGATFEVRQKFSDEPLTTHDDCGGTLQRLLSAPALQFKGSGWYITDYAKSAAKDNGTSKKGDSGGKDASASSDSGAASSSSAVSETKSETKSSPSKSSSSEKK